MRLSELITIYLAAAAPVGVIYFIRQQADNARRTHALARAAGAALLWPLSVCAFWLERAPRVEGAEIAECDETARVRRVEQAKRALEAALHAVEDVLADAPALRDEESRQVLFSVRACAERYAGLSLALEGAETEGEPSARELELCRIAGRAGDDLLLAGRCIHRTNVARLNAHQAHARTGLLHALADVREFHARLRPAPETCASDARRLSEATLRLCGRAVELFSVLEDRGAALSAARLLDAECARLGRLEVARFESQRTRAAEGELCQTLPVPPTPTRERHAPLIPVPTPTTSARG